MFTGNALLSRACVPLLPSPHFGGPLGAVYVLPCRAASARLTPVRAEHGKAHPHRSLRGLRSHSSEEEGDEEKDEGGEEKDEGGEEQEDEEEGDRGR